MELSSALVLESDTLDNFTGLDYYRRCAIQHLFSSVYGLAKPDQWNETRGDMPSVNISMVRVMENKKHK